jgi:U3 small nucleolar RNA-associated protein 23
MRGKRSKQYRKLMLQYMTFGFREPYQVLGEHWEPKLESSANKDMYTVDAQMIQDADRFKMDLIGGLERTLHGKVKQVCPTYAFTALTSFR